MVEDTIPTRYVNRPEDLLEGLKEVFPKGDFEILEAPEQTGKWKVRVPAELTDSDRITITRLATKRAKDRQSASAPRDNEQK